MDLSVNLGCAKVLPQPLSKKVAIRNEVLLARGTGKPPLTIETNCAVPSLAHQDLPQRKTPACEGFYWAAAKVHGAGVSRYTHLTQKRMRNG